MSGLKETERYSFILWMNKRYAAAFNRWQNEANPNLRENEHQDITIIMVSIQDEEVSERTRRTLVKGK